MKTTFQKYFKKRKKYLLLHLQSFVLTGDEESLHNFRLEIKKLRSIKNFFRNIYHKKEWKKAAQLIRSVFRAAGEMREFQLIKNWLEKSHFLVIEQIYFSEDTGVQLIKSFKEKHVDYTNNLKHVFKKIAPFVQHTDEYLLKQYTADIDFKLEMLVGGTTQSNWHDLRKLTKQKLYAYKWITQKIKKDARFEYYDKLGEKIGEWHDLKMIKNVFLQKQIYLSQNKEVLVEFKSAWKKLTSGMKRKEKVIEKRLLLLAKQ